MKDFFFGCAGTVLGFTVGLFGAELVFLVELRLRVRLVEELFVETVSLDPGLILSLPGTRTSANMSPEGLLRA